MSVYQNDDLVAATIGRLIDERDKAEAQVRSVLRLCGQSRAVVRVGCRCSTDECSGTCGAGKPWAWDLDPTEVLRALGEIR